MRGLEGVIKNFELLDSLIRKEVEQVVMETSADMEHHAKTHKAWNTISSHAEQNLRGKFKIEGRKAHAQIWQDLFGVWGDEYGYYLETAKMFKGKYAILRQTQIHYAPLFYEDLKSAIIEAIKNSNKGKS
ncbi:MAG: hypothetical protein ACTTIZ_01750 [Treponema sp.]